MLVLRIFPDKNLLEASGSEEEKSCRLELFRRYSDLINDFSIYDSEILDIDLDKVQDGALEVLL